MARSAAAAAELRRLAADCLIQAAELECAETGELRTHEEPLLWWRDEGR